MTFRLLSYWNTIRGDRKFPSLTDVVISDIEHLYHQTFVIKLGDTPEEHMFQYFGPDLASVFGEDFSDQYLIDAMEMSAAINNTIGFYEKVLDDRGPVSESSEFYLDGYEVRYRSLILPLSSDDITFDYLIGTTNYKIFD